MFVTHDVDEALLLGDRVAVLGAAGITAEFPLPARAERAGGPPEGLRERILAELGAAPAGPAAEPELVSEGTR
ncbi:hypothetical protein [Actinomadura sp. CNU-125]|uniref:hypothetical protein n=1 Tax=Actinomadura sp. CNU-125 TaxID=1904961 RepID=UPI0021CC4F84|nr:hypothetical protein [Actinomadura sp. CNU-125]